jgi:hypothetical protein
LTTTPSDEVIQKVKISWRSTGGGRHYAGRRHTARRSGASLRAGPKIGALFHHHRGVGDLVSLRAVRIRHPLGIHEHPAGPTTPSTSLGPDYVLSVVKIGTSHRRQPPTPATGQLEHNPSKPSAFSGPHISDHLKDRPELASPHRHGLRTGVLTSPRFSMN